MNRANSRLRSPASRPAFFQDGEFDHKLGAAAGTLAAGGYRPAVHLHELRTSASPTPSPPCERFSVRSTCVNNSKM